MQATLMESRRPRKRTHGGTVASILFHAALLTGVVAGTGISSPRPPTTERIDTLVYTPQPVHPTAPTETHGGSSMGVGGSVDNPFDIAPIPVPPLGDPIGPDGLHQTVIEPEFGNGPIVSGAGADRRPTSLGEVLESRDVDAPVQPLPGNAPPRYPTLLAAAGVEGRTVARFVVDTLGRVEPGSIMIVQSSHTLFERAVRDALEHHHFTAAMVGNHKVRQLVEQTFGFQLTR
ncbi:MAG: energy transducer TonB [Gemmatimonadaceae bacterium]